MEYLNVLLVDDEYLALEDLKSLIDWKSLKYHIVGTAQNGRQALDIISKNSVDIVITDISMPGMDGIELVRQVKEKNSQILFLLLTAYAEIDYMKRAFRLGVEDYLMKDEITPLLLTEKLESIREKLLSARHLNYTFWQKELQRAFEDKSSGISIRLEHTFKETYAYVIVVPNLIIPWLNGIALFEQFSIARHLTKALEICEVFQDNRVMYLNSVVAYNHKILLLLRLKPQNSEILFREQIRAFASHLQQTLNRQLNESYTIFYCAHPMNFRELHQDYFKQQETVRSHYFLDDRKIYALDDPRLFIQNQKLDLSESEFEKMFHQDWNGMLLFVNQIFQNIIETHNYFGLFQMLNICFSFIFYNRSVEEHELELSDLSNALKTHEWIVKQLQAIRSVKEQTNCMETEKAIRYIVHNYANEHLSVQEIANEAGLSPTHLSRIFKQDTGFSVWDFLTKHRIDEACKILKTTNHKIYEVAESVGYSSAQYFSQVFFKQRGITPIQYKKGNEK